jgi:hypothetical protein
MPQIDGWMIDDCDNCAERTRGICPVHGTALGGRLAADCDSAYHYEGSSPSELPNAGRGEPAVLCGICYRLMGAHRGDLLRARAGW